MAESLEREELFTLEEAERHSGVRRSTLYRYIRKGDLPTYRRAMDRHVHVRRADLDALRRFRRPAPPGGPTVVAVERARAFQQRVFGERQLATSTAELIEESRRERGEALP